MKLVSSLLIAGSLAMPGAPADAQKGSETALQPRINQFYKLVVEKKYREAEQFVAPQSRDAWYSTEKPSILDFAVKGVALSKDEHTADVTMESQTRMRRPRVGEFVLKVPYTSHWIFEQGQWWWYVPAVSERRTPFGSMKVNGEMAANSGVNLQEMIAKGPKPEELLTGVKSNHSTLTLAAQLGSSAGTILQNTLSGPVKLALEKPAEQSGISAELTKSDLGPGDRASLVVRRKSATVSAKMVSVTVSPTGQKIDLPITSQ